MNEQNTNKKFDLKNLFQLEKTALQIARETPDTSQKSITKRVVCVCILIQFLRFLGHRTPHRFFLGHRTPHRSPSITQRQCVCWEPSDTSPKPINGTLGQCIGDTILGGGGHHRNEANNYIEMVQQFSVHFSQTP